MRIAVHGLGAVGARAARQLLSSPEVDEVVLRDRDDDRLDAVARSLGNGATPRIGGRGSPEDGDVHVLALPVGEHLPLAREVLGAGRPFVSVSDSVDDVRALLDLGPEARERGVAGVAGAGFSPGLTCVLAAHGAAMFETVDEIHVAKVGTGGPACARQHHNALGGDALDWRDGAWIERPGGSGRELCWFPEPVGAADCYRAALPDALLLREALPDVRRITARVAANRRNRLTARLPRLRRPHPEGGPGAVRVELRGRRGGATAVEVLGAMDRPAVAAGAVAAVAAVELASGRVGEPGVSGLAQLGDPVTVLGELRRRGIRVAAFEGVDHRGALPAATAAG